MNEVEGRVFLTGDTHGRFERIVDFCEQNQLSNVDILIILGDVGLNYYGVHRDNYRKDMLAGLPCTFFCLHGNHEMRPAGVSGYHKEQFRGGQVWVKDQYPNIVFPIDGEIFHLAGRDCIVIGGAYSVDKYYRLARGWNWWPDEQPSQEVKNTVERVLAVREWKIDIVLSHTCPARYEPIEVFLAAIDQSSVDKSTEEWLGHIESQLHYSGWFCGHYHTDKTIDRIRFMFEDFVELEACYE